ECADGEEAVHRMVSPLLGEAARPGVESGGGPLGSVGGLEPAAARVLQAAFQFTHVVLGDADVRAGGGAAGPLVLQRLDTAQPLPFFGQPLPLVGEQPLGGGDALGLAGDVVEPEDASDAHDLSPLSSGGG